MMSLSGTVMIQRQRASFQSVMPAQAGIHLLFRCKIKEILDSGFRRNDGLKSRVPVYQFKLARRQFRFACHRLRMQLLDRDSREFYKRFAV
jgi:hypothetical protein